MRLGNQHRRTIGDPHTTGLKECLWITKNSHVGDEQLALSVSEHAVRDGEENLKGCKCKICKTAASTGTDTHGAPN